MSTEIRWATPADAAALALMLREIARHYREAPLGEAATLAAARMTGCRAKARPIRISRWPRAMGRSPAWPPSPSPIPAST